MDELFFHEDNRHRRFGDDEDGVGMGMVVEVSGHERRIIQLDNNKIQPQQQQRGIEHVTLEDDECYFNSAHLNSAAANRAEEAEEEEKTEGEIFEEFVQRQQLHYQQMRMDEAAACAVNNNAENNNNNSSSNNFLEYEAGGGGEENWNQKQIAMHEHVEMASNDGNAYRLDLFDANAGKQTKHPRRSSASPTTTSVRSGSAQLSNKKRNHRPTQSPGDSSGNTLTLDLEPIFFSDLPTFADDREQYFKKINRRVA